MDGFRLGGLAAAIFSGDLSGALDAGIGLFRNFGETALGVFPALGEGILGGLSSLWGRVMEAFAGLGAWASGVAESVGSAFSGAAEAVAPAVSGLAEAAVSAFGGVADTSAQPSGTSRARRPRPSPVRWMWWGAQLRKLLIGFLRRCPARWRSYPAGSRASVRRLDEAVGAGARQRVPEHPQSRGLRVLGGSFRRAGCGARAVLGLPGNGFRHFRGARGSRARRVRLRVGTGHGVLPGLRRVGGKLGFGGCRGVRQGPRLGAGKALRARRHASRLGAGKARLEAAPRCGRGGRYCPDSALRTPTAGRAPPPGTAVPDMAAFPPGTVPPGMLGGRVPLRAFPPAALGERALWAARLRMALSRALLREAWVREVPGRAVLGRTAPAVHSSRALPAAPSGALREAPDREGRREAAPPARAFSGPASGRSRSSPPPRKPT